MPPYKYGDIMKAFEGSRCNLLTTESQFNELIKETRPSRVKLDITSVCGHANIVIFKNFKFNNAGVLCHDCKNKKVSDGLKAKVTSNVFLRREVDFAKSFQIFIQDTFQSIVTGEGCESDMIIKPNNTEDDDWLRIQIKLTDDICAYDNIYRFCIHNQYKHHIIICHCIKKDVYWIIPGDNVKHAKISIGQFGGKYSEYLTRKEDIEKKLKVYYETTPLFEKTECLVPKSETHKQENLYRQKIYDNLQFLDVRTPEYTNSVFDLIVNNKKVQEKVMTKDVRYEMGYNVCLYKRKGRKGTQYYNCYDNDVYWLHVPETSLFFLIPEYELYKRDVLSLFEKEGKKIICLHTDYKDRYDHSWSYMYMFDYDNIDKEKFLNVLNQDYTEIMNSIVYMKMMDM